MKTTVDLRDYTIKARFIPMENITAYELAQIVNKAYNLVRPVMFTPEQWEGLSERIRAQFKLEE